MPWLDLLIISLLFIVMIGGIGWTKLQLWDWERDRDPSS